jgi:dUTP pyrophosphatase
MQEEPEKPTDYINDAVTYTDGAVLREPSPLDFIPRAAVKIKLLHPDAIVPKQGSSHSAGYDLYCLTDVVILPEMTRLIPLGFATEMSPSIHGRIESRSGLAAEGLVVLTGVIDSDYRGEWKVILRNISPDSPRRLLKGTKIAQVVFRPTIWANFQEVPELKDSERGTGGFGSTGQ